MTPWKLPLIVIAIAAPIVASFYIGGGGVGLGAGALVAFAIVVFAIRQRPLGEIVPPSAGDGRRHLLLVAAVSVEDPADVAAVSAEAGFNGEGWDGEVLVLVPARIGFLDRWASDVEGARREAQERLVASVAALAKAGVAAEARVGDEDIVQAVEDQLQSYPATDVMLVSDGEEDLGRAAAELDSRLQPHFSHVRLGWRQQV